MADRNEARNAFNIAQKPGTYLALIHKEDGTVMVKALKQDPLIPERLIEVNKKAGFLTETRDSQIYVLPRDNQVENVKGSMMRIVNYLEGYVQPITHEQAVTFTQLMTVVKEHKVPKGASTMVLLFDTIDERASVDDNLSKCNCGLVDSQGHSTDFKKEDVEAMIALKKDLKSHHLALYNDAHKAISHISENASVNMQNMIASHVYLEKEKMGMSVLGQILNSKNSITILMGIGLVLVLVLQNIK